MKSKLRNHLRALAHNIDPTVMVGQEGVTEAVIFALDQQMIFMH